MGKMLIKSGKNRESGFSGQKLFCNEEKKKHQKMKK